MLVDIGRKVGRTRSLSLERKVELAVNAHIRHQHTDYEGSLFEAQHGMSFEEYETQIDQGTSPENEEVLEVGLPLSELDTDLYHGLKAEAFDNIQKFLAKHRAPAANP